MRIQAGLLLLSFVGAACRSGSHPPGAAVAGASLLAPMSQGEAAHDELLRADIDRADSVARRGFADGFASAFDTNLVYLRGGLPIVRGRAAARAIVRSESMGGATAARWQPVRAETSRDGRSGYTYGYVIFGTAQSASMPALRIDRYIAFWRRQSVGWRVVAYAETYGVPPSALILPAEATAATVRDVPMSPARGALEAIRRADSAFSRDAATIGTGVAFGRYAADDAQMFSGPGEFINGPEAISRSFGSPALEVALTWHPVHGEISEAGDLGYTVGNAVATSVREAGASMKSYSKYLTVWRRQRDGSYRYVVDGGSARPSP